MRNATDDNAKEIERREYEEDYRRSKMMLKDSSSAPENLDETQPPSQPLSSGRAWTQADALPEGQFREKFTLLSQRLRTGVDNLLQFHISWAALGAVLLLLVVPATTGLIVRAYVKASHRALEINLTSADGSIDQVTSLAWGEGIDKRLFVGTRSGRLVSFDSSGRVVEDTETAGAQHSREHGAVISIQTTTGRAPIAVRLSDQPAWSTSSNGGSLAHGPETCKEGFVWREATEDDLVCVTPESRARAKQDNALAALNRFVAWSEVVPCEPGFVHRGAFSGDRVCVEPEVRNETQLENLLNQSRKALPEVARQATRAVSLMNIAAERGIVAVAGPLLITGRSEEPDNQSVEQQAQASAVPGKVSLTEWFVGVQGPVELGPIVGINDVSAIAPLPESLTFIVGDGAGNIFAVDASQQVSAVDSKPNVTRLGGHGAAVNAISVAKEPRGANAVFVTAAADGSIQAWRQAATSSGARSYQATAVTTVGRKWAPIPIDLPGPWSAFQAMSEDGRRLLVTSADNRLMMIDLPDGTDEGSQPTSTRLPSDISGPFAFSPDGKALAAVNIAAGTIDVFTGTSRRRLILGAMSSPFRGITFDPTGTRIALVNSDQILSVWEIGEDNAIVYKLKNASLASTMAFSPDGALLAIGYYDGLVEILQIAAQSLQLTLIGRLQLNPIVTAIAFSRDGRQLLVYNGEQTGSIFSVPSLQPISPILPADSALSANGNRLALHADSDTLTIFNPGRPNEVQMPVRSAEQPLDEIANVDASRVAVINSRGDLLVFRQEAGAMPPLSDDGLRLSADGTTLLLRESNGKLHAADITRIVDGRARLDPILTGTQAVQAELMPNGNSVLVVKSNNTIELINLSNNDRILISGHGDAVQAIAISPDGAHIASASLDGRLRISELERIRNISALPLASLWSSSTKSPMKARLLSSEAHLPMVPDRELLTAIQRRLNELTYGPIAVDGLMGPATLSALSTWRADNALPPNDSISVDLLRELNATTASKRTD